VEDILRRLGKRIREVRIAKGFSSQEEFADYCKMHRTFLGHLEAGRKDFRLTTIIRVAHALGVPLQHLFEGIEDAEPVKLSRAKGKPDSEGMLRELGTLERSLQRLKELVLSPPPHVSTESDLRKRPKSKTKRG
jgi:transcriptional regulator with XRE-family HTH domain